MDINIHNVKEVREQITHYTSGIKFICRNLIVVDESGTEFKISFFTEKDERDVIGSHTPSRSRILR